MTSIKSAISVRNLVKKYDTIEVVRDISFDVPSGSIFAFLGTNGAGKSTTINCLVTTLEPTGGEILIDGKRIGKDDVAIKQKIGVVFQSSLLDPELTVRENLAMRGSLYLPKEKLVGRINELITLIDMGDFVDRSYGKLSGGQRRRADIARALLHDPSILFLDEPTTGLDPKSRETVWTLIRGLQKKQGKTIFLTTHYMEETENADSVAILNQGRIISIGTPQSLRAEFSNNTLRLVSKNPAAFAKLLKDNSVVYQVAEGGVFVVYPHSSSEALTTLNKLKDHIKDFEFRHGNMDDVFLKLAEGDGKS